MLPSTIAVSVFLLPSFVFILSAAILNHKRHKNELKEPPGPRALPIIGNLHMLGKLPHRTLQSLARRYGPIMSLRLGQVPTVVVSSSKSAELFLKTNDAVFASRPKIEATEYMNYGSKGLVFCEYGAYWRNMRKVCTLQLLTTSRVEMFAPLRREELKQTVKSIEEASKLGEVVDLSEMVRDLIENIVYKMILGRTKDDTFDLKGLIEEAMSIYGVFNLADYVPWLAAFDFQGLRRRFKKTSKALDQLLEKIIREHEQASNIQNGENYKDFIDIFLSLLHQPFDSYNEESHVIDRTNMKATVFDMILGAFDTATTAIEWALSELLRHERVMKKLQHELETVIGMNRMVEEIHIHKLSYLDMVVKEIFRLHPVGPLVPRESVEDVLVDGYYIKKKTRVLINLWAIGRDPNVWSDNADRFYPERFINKAIDIRGHDFELIPFGSGRRRCPGMLLGLTTVKFIIAQLVHCFNWELPYGMAPDDLDMNEKFGLSIPRAKHLLALPSLRLSNELGQVRNDEAYVVGTVGQDGSSGLKP